MWLSGLGVEQRSIAAGWKRIRESVQGFVASAKGSLFEAEASDLVIEGSCHAALMFGSVAPTVTAGDVRCLAGHLVSLADSTGDPPALRALVTREPIPPLSERPWEHGYSLAERLLESLGLDACDEPVDMPDLLDRLGIWVEAVALADLGIRGVSIAGPRHHLAILVNTRHDANQYPSGYRFTLAHELCHMGR
jgi:hypothetical protein